MARLRKPPMPDPLALPRTAAALIAAWQERDERYKGHRSWLSWAEIGLIRPYRQAEAASLPAVEFAIAHAWLGRWTPPVPVS